MTLVQRPPGHPDQLGARLRRPAGDANLYRVSRRFVHSIAMIAMSVLAVGASLILAPAGRADAACTCTATPVADGLAGSQVVFTGELVAVIPGEVLNTLEFHVDTVFKGDVVYDTKVATLAAPGDCGLIDPPLGPWMIFASQFPAETGPLIANICGPSAALPVGQPPPPELLNGSPPVDRPEIAATTEPPPPVSIAGELPSDWRPSAVSAVAALAALGLAARILAGRRRRVVV